MKKDTRKPETIIRDLKRQLADSRSRKIDGERKLVGQLLEERRAKEMAERERDILRRALAVLEKSVGIESEDD